MTPYGCDANTASATLECGEPSTATKVSPRLRVLAIDDNDDFRMLVKEMMEANGYHVECTGNPVKGLEMFRTAKQPYDLVLLDYYMPQLDGGKTCEWIRTLNSNVKIIICSGADEFQLRRIQSQYAIDGYIHKPFRLAEAEFVINQVMKKTSRC